PYCHNYEKVSAVNSISNIGSNNYEISFNDFVQLFFSLYHKVANNIELISPTSHLPYIEKALKILKNHNPPLNPPIPIIFKSSGYESVKRLQSLRGLIDIYLPDFKYVCNSQFALKATVTDYFNIFQKSLKEMYQQIGDPIFDQAGILQKGVVVRFVKGLLPKEEELEALRYLEELKNRYNIVVSILDHYTPIL
ncbi:MAG: hypothetical protein HQK51_19825, partial [Oligoflexia bacterium]|nr:hypothetical protein [Oligoflexia bacterium]